jgi:hypothetical protein
MTDPVAAEYVDEDHSDDDGLRQRLSAADVEVVSLPEIAVRVLAGFALRA